MYKTQEAEDKMGHRLRQESYKETEGWDKAEKDRARAGRWRGRHIRYSTKGGYGWR